MHKPQTNQKNILLEVIANLCLKTVQQISQINSNKMIWISLTCIISEIKLNIAYKVTPRE